MNPPHLVGNGTRYDVEVTISPFNKYSIRAFDSATENADIEWPWTA